MGAARLREIQPWMEPKTLAGRGGGLVPAFEVGARGIVGRRMASDAAREVSGWRYEYRSTRLARVAATRGGSVAICVPRGASGSSVMPEARIAGSRAAYIQIHMTSDHATSAITGPSICTATFMGVGWRPAPGAAAPLSTGAAMGCCEPRATGPQPAASA
jgi:hypothetical protein